MFFLSKRIDSAEISLYSDEKGASFRFIFVIRPQAWQIIIDFPRQKELVIKIT